MASSSTAAGHQRATDVAGTPSPPPPTPSTHSINKAHAGTSADADAALSRFLHQLLISPSLSPLSSPPPRRRSGVAAPPPTVSLRRPRPDVLRSLVSAAAEFGFFHLIDHGVSPDVAAVALDESKTLALLPPNPNKNRFLLGFDHEIDVDGEDESGDDDGDRILALESEERSDFDGWESLQGMKEFGKSCKGIALDVLDMLSSIEGGIPENPILKGNYNPRCLIWISSDCRNVGVNERSSGLGGVKEMKNSKCYPYIVGIHYQFEMKDRQLPHWIIGNSGEWINVQPCPSSLLVTVGDIAQVWSNGRFKKVNGRPQPIVSPVEESGFVSLSVFLTLPLDCVIYPILPILESSSQFHASGDDNEENDGAHNKRKYGAFSLEEYAWRVYHERLPLKDPLLRFQV